MVSMWFMDNIIVDLLKIDSWISSINIFKIY